MKIGILYICTGKYKIFWKDFYQSCEKNFIPNAEKQYFVFTDSPEIEFEKENKNIIRVYQENLGWPNNTLKRYAMFATILPRLEKLDYLFFFNANLLFIEKIISEEFLPQGQEKLVGCLHPGYYDKPIDKYPYDKNLKSMAKLNDKNWHYYYQGAINGGNAREFIEIINLLKHNVDIDTKNNLIALWHDESHWNKYLNEHQNIVRTLTPSYLYPEGFSLPFKPKILIRGKNKYFGGLNQIRNIKKSLNLNYLRTIVKKIIDKVIYNAFAFYDSIFCSYFFILKLQKNKPTIDKRKISIAITSYNSEKILYKSLKNIVNDDRVHEIVILDDGSEIDAFAKTEAIVKRFGPKIRLFRREQNLGVLTTKIQVIRLCRNDWVILLDSDNTINKSYLDSIYSNQEGWGATTIYCPSRPLPLLDFRSFNNIDIDFRKVKELLVHNTTVTENLLNDGNFFLNKISFLESVGAVEFFNPKAADIIFMNYIWLSDGNKIKVLPRSSYLHRIHKMSTWLKSCGQSSTYFEQIKNKFLFSETADIIKLQGEIPHTENPNYKIQKIL